MPPPVAYDPAPLEFAEGPPPPGYVKTRGESVPDWSDATAAAQPDSHPGSPPSRGRPRRTGRGGGFAITWQALGPKPIEDEYWSDAGDASGRIVSIAPHPTEPDTVYIAAASGGIWKTADAGASWSPLSDELSTLVHGAVAIDPTNPKTIYAATGEYTTLTTGDGLFRSKTDGATWQRIASAAEVGATCSRLIVDPLDPERIHVGGDIGYVQSGSGGPRAAWTVQFAGNVSDLAINPQNPLIIYVAQHSVGIHRSTNGGKSFKLLTGGLPSSGIRRIVMAISTSQPDVLIAAFVNATHGLEGLYRTIDAGNSWSRLSAAPDFPAPQGWYNCCIGIHPSDSNLLLAGGTFPSPPYPPGAGARAGLIRSAEGGSKWDDVTTSGQRLHPDQHAIAFGADGTVWVGNDGGVFRSTDLGLTWINCNAGLNVTQNYAIDPHPTDPLRAIAGTQDNGNIARPGAAPEWSQFFAGDGGFLAYERGDPSIRYVTTPFLFVYRAGPADDVRDITGPWRQAFDRRDFTAPLVIDPNQPHTLLAGTYRVWRTANAQVNFPAWTALSGDLSGGPAAVLTALAPVIDAPGVVYTGSSLGRVYVTVDDGANWIDRSAGLPAGWVRDIRVRPGAAQQAYVAIQNTSGPRVLTTSNFGQSWKDATGGLPSGVSARALEVDWTYDPPHLYIGSGVGVYASFDGGATWSKDAADLPNAIVGDLAIDRPRHTLTAATYGRGAWRAKLPVNCDSPPIPGEDCNTNNTIDVCETDAGQAQDCNTNDVPDECDPQSSNRPLFVALLLSRQPSPVLVCMLDQNGDGVLDGEDVQGFVDRYAGR